MKPIQPRDWFMLAARVIGVWVLYNGMTYLAAFAEFFIGYRVETERDNSRTYMLQTVFHLVFALYLLFGTSHLAKHIYGEELSNEGNEAPVQPTDTTNVN